MLPGHLDVGEQQRNIGPRLQDAKGLVGIDGFDRRIASVFHDIDRPHAQHHVVFDDEHDRWNFQHNPAFSAARRHQARLPDQGTCAGLVQAGGGEVGPDLA